LRKLIVKIRSSPQSRERFARHAKIANFKNLNLILDVKTRWNSTYDMLNRAFEMREVIDVTASLDKELRNFELIDDEWNRINDIISVLKIFVRTTKTLSSATYPMLASVIPIYNYLIDGLETYCDKFDDSSDIVIAIKAGLKKLEIYYTKTDDTIIYTIATILDPRLKLDYYIDNNWKQKVDDSKDENDDEFLDHIFGKQKKVQNNEVELYLKAPRAARDQD
ncbi:1117_t:CDS:2, partial [Ambispora gerdemannii]